MYYEMQVSLIFTTKFKQIYLHISRVRALPPSFINFEKLISGTEIKDGERVPVVAKDMGSCEIYPQTIAHNPNGRFVVVCGDGEYIIYTAMALRNKAFGTAQEFVWAFDSSEYATLENSSTIKVFKNFKERKSFKPEYGAEGEIQFSCS